MNMKNLLILLFLVTGIVEWPVNAATCSAGATGDGCPVVCFVYIFNGIAACSETACDAECKTWDEYGNPIEHVYYSCDSCTAGSGGAVARLAAVAAVVVIIANHIIGYSATLGPCSFWTECITENLHILNILF